MAETGDVRGWRITGDLNVAAMAAITLLIFAEKSLPLGQRISLLGAAVLIAYGLVAVFAPDVLPTMMTKH